MTELYLFPDERVVVQAAVYLAGLASAHYFLVKPLLALQKERLSRTTGASQGAVSEQQRIDALEKEYLGHLSMATEDARDIRNKEVLAGQAAAEEILRGAQNDSRIRIDKIKNDIERQLESERKRVPQYAEDVARSIVQKVSSGLAVVIFCFVALLSPFVAFSAGDGKVDFWYGLFWPYFQFAMFALGLWYFGRVAISKMLQKKRDTMRTQLSEAKQAVHAAQLKISEYEKKIARLETDIETIRATHVAEGLRQREELIAEAREIREQIVKDTERRASEIVRFARESIRRELIDEAMTTVQKQLAGPSLEKIGGQLRKSAMAAIKQAY